MGDTQMMRRYIVVAKAESIDALDEALETGLADFTVESYNVVTEDEVPIGLDFEESELDPEIRALRTMVKDAVRSGGAKMVGDLLAGKLVMDSTPVAKVRRAIVEAMATGEWEDTAHLIGFALEGKVR